MITNLPGYGSRSLNNPKLAKVKVEDTRGQAQFVHIPTRAGLCQPAATAQHTRAAVRTLPRGPECKSRRRTRQPGRVSGGTQTCQELV